MKDFCSVYRGFFLFIIPFHFIFIFISILVPRDSYFFSLSVLLPEGFFLVWVGSCWFCVFGVWCAECKNHVNGKGNRKRQGKRMGVCRCRCE